MATISKTSADEIPCIKRKPFYRGLFFQVLVAVALGILVGLWNPEFGFESRVDKLHEAISKASADTKLRTELQAAIPRDQTGKELPHNLLTDKTVLQNFIAERHGKDAAPVRAFLDSFQSGLSNDHPLKAYKSAGFGEALKPLGDAFINLIKMMIGPIIFCTIVTGIASIGDMKEAGRIGIKALIYFEVLTTIPLIMGLVAVHIFEPGSGMALDAASTVSADALTQVQARTAQGMQSTSEFLMNIIPHTFVSAFTEGQILQVLLVALLFAFGVSMMGEKGKPIVHAIETISVPIFNIISLIIKLAPIGVFGAMAFSVSKFGIGALADLGGLMLLFFATCILFVTVVLGSIMRFYCKLSLWQFIKYIREEIIISFGTASSEAVLPRMIDRMTHLGCARPVVGMVLPTGYSFNLDGTTLYLSLAAMFVAYACGIDLTWGQQFTLLAVLMLTSKGAAAVYGAAFVVLAATLNSLHVFPADTMAIGLALLFSIDRIMAPGRVLTNLIGNGVATLVIAKWENELDYELAKKILSEGCEPLPEAKLS